MKITQEDVEALESAISEKWEPLLLTKEEGFQDAVEAAIAWRNCPCCVLGEHRAIINDSEDMCKYCAISDFTGCPGCRETPLSSLRKRADASSSKHSMFLQVVKEEIDFLNKVMQHCKDKLIAG